MICGEQVEHQGEKDRRAYKAMRQQGLQPPHVDGAHELSLAAEAEDDIRPMGERIFRRWQKMAA